MAKKTFLRIRVCSLVLTVILLCQIPLSVTAAEVNHAPVLKLDRADIAQLPRNFRTSDDPYRSVKNGNYPSREGLAELHASGSSAFSEMELRQVLSKVRGNVFIVDLRQESHAYLNGMAVSWFAENNWGNDGKNLEQVTLIERALLDQTLAQSPVYVHHFDDKTNTVLETFQVDVATARTEQEVVKSLGAGYFRLACADHFRPEDADVDRFIQFYKKLPKDAWLHFHCFAGQGRATIFMNMYDMLKNAKKVSFDDIVTRQGLIGPVDLRHIPDSKKNWGKKAYIERLQFVKHFYAFVKHSPDNLPVTWSQWAAEHDY